MNDRPFVAAVMRGKVLVPGVIGAGLLIGQVSTFWGLVLIAYAAWKASWYFAHPAALQRRRLQGEMARHGIDRMVSESERREIMAIEAYSRRLKELGGDARLADELTTRAYQLVRESTADAAAALRAFRHGLPPLAHDGQAPDASLAKRLAREVDLLRAAQKELESLS